MFIELVEQLRCPREHEETWLVASVDRLDGRTILEGALGCPVCATRYPVAEGVVDLRVPDEREAPESPTAVEDIENRDEALRVAALLDLVEPGGFVVLTGTWAGHARALTALVEPLHILAVNADIASRAAAVSVIRAAGTLPVRAGSARGVALDERHASPAQLGSAARVARAGGRVIAPATAVVPTELRELARDARHWVAERPAAVSAAIPLRRADPR